jgi:hypothetical protein
MLSSVILHAEPSESELVPRTGGFEVDRFAESSHLGRTGSRLVFLRSRKGYTVNTDTGATVPLTSNVTRFCFADGSGL